MKLAEVAAEGAAAEVVWRAWVGGLQLFLGELAAQWAVAEEPHRPVE